METKSKKKKRPTCWNSAKKRKIITALSSKFISTFKKLFCPYCKNEFSEENYLTIDHIIPRCKNGANCLDNLIICCYKCNQERGIVPFEKFFLSKNNDNAFMKKLLAISPGMTIDDANEKYNNGINNYYVKHDAINRKNFCQNKKSIQNELELHNKTYAALKDIFLKYINMGYSPHDVELNMYKTVSNLSSEAILLMYNIK